MTVPVKALGVRVRPVGGRWRPVSPAVGPGEKGSLSDNPEGGRREVYVFGWLEGVGDAPVVARSIGGVDIDWPVGLLREVTSLGWDVCHTFESGSWWETTVTTPNGTVMDVRIDALS